MKKKCQVVMLPTEKASIIQKWGVWLFYDINKKLSNREPKAIFQQLYILSDEEIKEGDWILDNRPIKENDEDANLITKAEYNIDVHPLVKKIIATTNSELWIDPRINQIHIVIPSIPQSFIEEYIKEYNSGNIIKEVMVEYELYKSYKFGPNLENTGKHFLKLNSDNTIIISKVEEKKYSRDEVLGILKRREDFIFNPEIMPPLNKLK